MGSRRKCKTLFFALAPAFYCPYTWACPICHSETGAQIRAGIFDNYFGLHLLAVILPFSVFMAIGFSLYYGWPLNRRSSTKHVTEIRKGSSYE